MYAHAIAIVFTILVLISASIHDVRSREVPDYHWILLCGAAVAMAFYDHEIGCALLITAGYVLLSAYMFSPRLVGVPGILTLSVACVLLLLAYLLFSAESALVTLSMSIILLALYHIGLLRGGADAKALISLAMLFPSYPEIGHILWDPVYPEAYVFNPVLSILLLALLLSLLSVNRIMWINHMNGDCGFSEYKMDLDEARKAFVWPREDIVNGQKVRAKITEDVKSVYDRLEAAGEEQVWVTPMIPFVLPITLAFAFIMILGSPLFLLVI